VGLYKFAVGRWASISETVGLRQRFWYDVIVLSGCAAVVVLAMLLDFDGEGLELFGLRWPMYCSLYRGFGVRCALCGLTRSFCALVDGDLISSVRYHRLGPVVFMYVCLQGIYRVYLLAVRPRRPSRKLVKVGVVLSVVLVVGLFVNWVIYLGGLFI